MHNLKPNTNYVTICIQVVVTEEDYRSGAYADINTVMDNGMFELDGTVGVIADWQFSTKEDDEVSGTYRTHDEVEEGEVFDPDATGHRMEGV